MIGKMKLLSLKKIFENSKFINTKNSHLYNYCSNNPITYIDPNGRNVISNLCKILLGGGKVITGGFGFLAFGSITGILVADDCTVIGVVNDALVFFSATGFAISGVYAVYGLEELSEGLAGLTYDIYIGVNNEIEFIFTLLAEMKIKAKERRKQEKEKSKTEKHGTSDWEEPASESYGNWKAREAEKQKGKDARREGHDRKGKGEPDRSKKQLGEDYE